MEQFIVFENAVFRGRFEYAFYRYCLHRQMGLLKKLPLMWVMGFLRFFGLCKQSFYLEKVWSFLPLVRDFERVSGGFFKKYRRRMYIPGEGTTVLSVHPAIVLSAFCQREGLKLRANEYDPVSRHFVDFAKAKARLPEGSFAAWGTVTSPIMRKASDRYYLMEGWITRKKLDCYVHMLMTWLCLTVFAAALGLLSLYYACRTTSVPTEIFGSYLSNPLILALNIAPAVLCAWLLYAIFDRAWVSGGLTALLTMIPTLINHYKLLFRDDPFLLEDVLIAMEARAMSERYSIVIEKKMLIFGVLIAAAVVLLAFFCRGRVRVRQVRIVAVAGLIVLAVWGLRTYYLPDTVYNKTANEAFINRWSSTQQFQSRGFWYPFIHSAATAVDRPPEGYDEAEAAAILAQYDARTIPENKKVNVISIMLEAYGDFRKFDNLEFTQDPYLFWDMIAQDAYTGKLVTNIFAAGTIDTERCFISGLSDLPSFRRQTNSYAWYFRDQGYTVEGSHPCYNWFYNRQNVNPNLGFENYYFDEDTYMALNNGKHTADDQILFGNLVKQFGEATARGEDYFSFSVTYEGHGPYDDSVSFNTEFLKNTGGWSVSDYNTINNYFYLINDVNLRLFDMVNSLRRSEEPVVLILFGDHMPWMGNANSVYSNLGLNIDVADDEGFLNYYETPYMIWANDAAREKLRNDFVGTGRTLSPCFLMNEFFSLAGYTGDEYSQYLSDLSKALPVINVTGVCMDDVGNLLRELSEEQSDLAAQFERVQYYRRTNFAY